MHKNINFNQALSFLNEKVHKKDITFYKGINSSTEIKDFVLIDPKNSTRESKTKELHGDIYNILLNNLKNWQKYPLRKNSIIFTDKQSIAENFSKNGSGSYGKIFQVFPIHNAEIVVSPEYDIWYSFKKGLAEIGLRGTSASLIEFNSILDNILADYNTQYPSWDYKSIVDSLQLFIEKNNQPSKQLEFQSQIVHKKLLEKKLDAEQILNEIFNPELNGFEMKKFDVNFSIESSEIELWTDSTCLLINIDLVEQVLSKLN